MKRSGLTWGLWGAVILAALFLFWKQSPSPKSVTADRPSDVTPAPSITAETSKSSAPEKAAEDISKESPSASSNLKLVESTTKFPATPERRRQFLELTQKVESSFPTQKELQQLTDHQAHYTPEVIHKSAAGLGEIAQALADNKDLSADGIRFYRECAENEAHPSSLRATCFVNHEELLKKNPSLGESLAKDAKIADQVKDLAKKIQ